MRGSTLERIIRHRIAIWERIGVGTGTELPVWRCSMKLEDFAFGCIQVDGTVYDHDLVIDHGKIKKRKKKPYRESFGGAVLSW